uniref:DUF295 domain-containing protein n=1 Tax=Aegilops tauschii subsp. strangulata TaxID=200361 RepID=A0A453N8C6_AEGTS
MSAWPRTCRTRPDGSFRLVYTTQNNSESPKEWRLESVISLPGQYDYFTVGAAEGFLFLGGTTESQQDCHETEWADTWDIDYFSVEVQTSELKKICRMTKPCFNHERVLPYFGFPPSLSRPTI